MIRTGHTVLCKVLSHKTIGRAKILFGHKSVSDSGLWADPALKSKRFNDFEVGDFVVVKILLSGRRRLIQRVKKETGCENIPGFKKIYKITLKQESSEYAKKTGVAPSGLWADEMDTYEEIAKSEKEFHAKKKLLETIKMKPESAFSTERKIYIDKKDEVALNVIRKIAKKRHVSILMVGASGYGKTSIPEQKAKDWDMDFLRWDCATIRDPEEFFGLRGAINGSTMTEDGETFFSRSKFTECVENGNCVIVLDELNRTDPYITNILFPLLDHAGKTSVAGHNIVVGPNVVFVATINVGYQFTGTFTLDTALTNRFSVKILVSQLPEHIEVNLLMDRVGIDTKNATKIVSVMRNLRKLNENGQLSVDASTRVSLQLAELVFNGLSVRDSLIYVIMNGISKEEAKLVIDQFGLS